MSLERKTLFNNHSLCWGVSGEFGGVHIWFDPSLKYGGIEIHGRSPLYDGATMSDEDCWLIGGKCCHDGSGLWWQDRGCYLLSSAMDGRSDRILWDYLEDQYVSRFGLVQDEAGHWVNKEEKDDERALAKAYAAELDQTPVDEQWLRENGAKGQTNTFLVFPGKRMECVWYTYGEWSLHWYDVEFRNPTRGLVRTLMRIGGGM